jgi:predicted RNA-binding Zn ribbon-like protein
MPTSPGRPDSDWRDGFLFLGNQVALDFLNTCPVMDGTPTELLPDWSALVRWFLAAELISPVDAKRFQQEWTNSKHAQRIVESMQQFREELRKAIISWEHTGQIPPALREKLNDLMARHPMRTRLTWSDGQSATELYSAPDKPEDLFAPLAYFAATLFATVDPSKVRKCHHCVLHFHDTSKKGTRRWCSMQLCGNRQKVAAYAARQRLQRE